MLLRRGLRIYAIAGLVAVLGFALSLPQIGFRLEEDVGLAWLFDMRGPRPAPPEAVIVRFDRDALARLRALPADPVAWPQPLAGCFARNGPMPNLAEATRLDRLPRGVPVRRRGADTGGAALWPGAAGRRYAGSDDFSRGGPMRAG